MNLLVNLPTRSRLEKCVNTLKMYHELSTYENIRFVVSCDADDLSMNNTDVINMISSFPSTEIVFNENKIQVGDQKSHFTTKISAINSGVINQDFDVCLLASDDMHPEVKGYDSMIINDMKKHFPDTDGVLWYNDGYQADKLNTLCIFGKKYYDRFKYIYHPSYITLYCDDEFTQVSQRLGKCKYINKTIIRHKHWSHKDNLNERDHLDQKNDVFAGYDHANFQKRQANDFA